MDVTKVQARSQLLQSHSPHLSQRTSVQKLSRTRDSEEGLHKPFKNQEEFNKEKMKQVIDALNDILKPAPTNLQFQFHEKLEEYYVKIVNSQTKEVVKEIPPKNMLDFYAAMIESIGLIVDDKI
ncbi:flagellar protein FlaG [Halobacillus naozhouensis]|uniref:Flagellar protein FlaG n=1 Tax=Halobacillus naozhouensis TaxID=554880 RepID=A0ABY8IUG9_9BACI|nr:flagellar protein FlaG [Halobacillus naozhouensis]WFT73773.1 flagellar protein FlaG [Halobacillus naozhouensis]